MLDYSPKTKLLSRQLRKTMTESERRLWSRLRKKQILGVQFYRQKPIGAYIVDFYCAKAKLVVEVDGSQHYQDDNSLDDQKRDHYLAEHGLIVLRFNNRQVLLETDAVVNTIYQNVKVRLAEKIPPGPPFPKGGEEMCL